MSNLPVIVYGPQSCGKTRNAEKIKRYFRAAKLVDDWKVGDEVEDGAVYLTNDNRAMNTHPRRTVQFSDVERMLT